VQHADADPAFQRECLGLLTGAVGQGEARRIELADPDGESEGACPSCGMTFRIAPADPGDYGDATP
jgi:hypothetical protein